MAGRFKRQGKVREPVDLPSRIHKAEVEGRWQQALELAKALYKQDPSPPHRDIIKQTTMGRVGQLRTQGHLRDAATALENALAMDAAPAWRERVANEMAACGEVRRALDLILPFPDSPALPRIWALAADWSMSQGKTDQALLPEEMRAQLHLIQKAFREVEAGQDEEAKATLQAIGLRSPFLDWKMLVRGLIAHYQGDPARALENWGRLDPERLPARLAAPLRFTIDPAYRMAQAPAAQASLHQQADRLHSSGLVKPLREIQANLAHDSKMAQAFRLAENLLPSLRHEAPHLVPRLATCFYWAIAAHGGPDEAMRYERVFGKPPDDPNFSRLGALAFEESGHVTLAQTAWQDHEKEIADGVVTWPGAHAARVRALIWDHLGNAAAGALAEDAGGLDELFSLGPRTRSPSQQPSPEKCFERSLELAPDQPNAYQNLFGLLMLKKKPDEAIKVARRLLERVPDHVPMLKMLGGLLLERKEAREALTLLQRALHNNPLDRQVRDLVAAAHIGMARQHAEAGEFEEARKHYRTIEALSDNKAGAPLLCKWAGCEFKAGAAEQAESLLQRALAEQSPLGVAYNMVIETARLKLPKPVKSRFDKEFKAALEAAPTPRAAADVATIAASYKEAKVIYAGQKTHEKKIVAYLENAFLLEFTQAQMEQVAAALMKLDAPKLALRYVRGGQKRFPGSPFFFLAEIDLNVARGPNRLVPSQTERLLNRAQKLTEALPAGDQKTSFLTQIQEKQALLEVLGPFGSSSPFAGVRGFLAEMLGEDVDEEDDGDF